MLAKSGTQQLQNGCIRVKDCIFRLIQYTTFQVVRKDAMNVVKNTDRAARTSTRKRTVVRAMGSQFSQWHCGRIGQRQFDGLDGESRRFTLEVQKLEPVECHIEPGAWRVLNFEAPGRAGVWL